MTKHKQTDHTQDNLTVKRHAISFHVFDILFDEMRRCQDMQVRIERCYR